MPTGHGGGQPDDGQQPFDPDPAAPGSLTRKFITYGKDSDGNEVPLKTFRITNNTADTVYPIMRAPNSNILKSNPAVGFMILRSAQQGIPWLHRLPAGQILLRPEKGESIEVSLPLVFWNGARIGIGTDGKHLQQAHTQIPYEIIPTPTAPLPGPKPMAS